jgi:DUF1365 family protein
MDAEFDFKLRIPNESLHIKIDDFKGDKSFFKSTLWGKKKPLNNANVAWYAIRFPMITLSYYVAHSLECFCIVAETDSVLCQKIAFRAPKRHI